jgi:hypothetical protein
MRWSKKVREGLNLIYGYMSNEYEVGQWSALECAAGEDGPCGKCKGCLNNKALEAGLAWLGNQIDKHSQR